MSRVELPVKPLGAWPGPQTPASHRMNNSGWSKLTPGRCLDTLRSEGSVNDERMCVCMDPECRAPTEESSY